MPPPLPRGRRSALRRRADGNIASVYTRPTRSHAHRCSRLGLAIVPLCRGTGAPFDEYRRPLVILPDNNNKLLITNTELM